MAGEFSRHFFRFVRFDSLSIEDCLEQMPVGIECLMTSKRILRFVQFFCV